MLESMLRRLIFAKTAMGGALVEATATGNPLTFLTDKAKPLKSLLVPFTPKQTGTGDPAPDNVRPITGWTGVKVEHFDSNLLTINRSSAQTTQGITYTPIKQDNKTVAVKAEGTRSSNNPFFNLDYVNGSTVAFPVGTHKIFGGTPEVRLQVFYKDSGGTERIAGYDAGEGATVTVPADATASWCRLLVVVDTPVDTVIYPIVMSADSSVNVHPVVFPATGKNLFSAELEQGGIVGNTGMDTSTTNRVRTKGFIPLTEGQYTISAVGVGQVYYYSYNEDGTYNVSESSGFKNLPFTINVLGNRKYRFAFRVSSNSEDVTPSDVSNVQLEKGTQATLYEPYTNTVYGGTLDVVSGVLTVEYFGFTTKWKNGTNASVINGITRKRFPLPYNSVDASVAQTAFCDKAKWQWSYDKEEVHFYTHQERAYVFFPNETDGETDIQIVWKLATPQEIQLTPEQITAIVGDNTIWSDTNGSNTVVYLKKA